MSFLALSLILLAAILHATWNLLVKKVAGGVTFQWLFGVLSSVLYLPLVFILIVSSRPVFGARELVFVGGSSLLHSLYYFVLQRGYRAGELSLVYPLARGSGPLVATAAAIVFFGERPGVIALSGMMLVVSGVFILTGGTLHPQSGGTESGKAVSYGLMTGVVIACYTLWDKYSVSTVAIPPLLLDWGANMGRTLLLAPAAALRWEEVRATWQTHRAATLGVAVLNPLAYILVLTALTFTPVSYVAPAREISILIGALMGVRLLSEKHPHTRLAGAIAMMAGVCALVIN